MEKEQFIKKYVEDYVDGILGLTHIDERKIFSEIVGMNRYRRINNLPKLFWLSPDLVEEIVKSIREKIIENNNRFD